jgi:hypothetical protein
MVFCTGNYSRISCRLKFLRSFGYYLIQSYFPVGFLVIFSWISFWIDRKALGQRFAITSVSVRKGCIIYLNGEIYIHSSFYACFFLFQVISIMLLWAATNSVLPKISYIKAMDVYFGTCFLMALASLLCKISVFCHFKIMWCE